MKAKPDLLAKHLREQIFAGVYPPGSQLPTMKLLMAEHDLSSVTVQRAIDVLKREGIVEARRPRGVFVSSTLSISQQRYALTDFERPGGDVQGLRLVVEEDLPYQETCWQQIAAMFRETFFGESIDIQFRHRLTSDDITSSDVCVMNSAKIGSYRHLLLGEGPFGGFGVPVSRSLHIMVIDESCLAKPLSPQPTVDGLLAALCPGEKVAFYERHPVRMLDAHGLAWDRQTDRFEPAGQLLACLSALQQWCANGRMSLWPNGMTTPGAIQAFSRRETAAIATQSSHLPYVLAHIDFPVRLVAHPWQAATPPGIVAAMGINTSNQEGARLLRNYLASDPVQELLLATGGNPPFWRDVETATAPIHPDLPAVLAATAAEQLASDTDHRRLNDVVIHAARQVVGGEMSPQQAVAFVESQERRRQAIYAAHRVAV